MSVEIELDGQGQVCYYANILRAGALVGSVSLPQPVANRIAACVALADRARKWVSDYETRCIQGQQTAATWVVFDTRAKAVVQFFKTY